VSTWGAEVASNVITLSTPSGQRFALNPDLVRRIDAGSQGVETVITLVDGISYDVAETLETVSERMLAYRVAVVTGEPTSTSRLHLVD
jgi:flagellar protein FlbD